MFDENNTTIIAIDIQEKLVNMLSNKDGIASNCTKLLKAANILNIETLLTEQYPKGLGSTISSVKEICDFNTIEKTSFSVLRTEVFKNKLDKSNNNNILLFGIETHICVLQSAIDLLKNGYSVFIIKDCCASRKKSDNDTALEFLKQEGCKIITLEIALFEFLKSSNHRNFKEIQGLIK